MPYQPTLTTLGYILSKGKDSVLLLHRNSRADDHHYGKYNGLGGKLEALETPPECFKREVHEESGLTVTDMVLRGTMNWPGFAGGNVFSFVYLVTEYTGEPYSSSEEGSLEWHPLCELLNGTLPIWEGDKLFLPLVFDRDPRPFHGLMPYNNGKYIDWKYTR